MKTQLLLLSFLLFTFIVSAQDTIFVKNGQAIPATIVGKDAAEIKYKKFGQPEPAAIYSVFISDIKSIHYMNGIVADYTSTGQSEINGKPQRPVDLAGTWKVIRWSFGLSRCDFKRTESDNLLLFWQNRNNDNTLQMDGNPAYYQVDLKAVFVAGQSGRNWMGTDLQLVMTPNDAIHVINVTGSNEIKLKSFYYNITLFYGHTLNHKKTLAAIIEPGLDIAFMGGFIKLNNKEYNLYGNFGAGFHLALGADWIISKRLSANARLGQRFMTVKESHKNSDSSTGYSNFYVHPNINEDLLTIKWNGPYASLGLAWSLYSKMKYGRPE